MIINCTVYNKQVFENLTQTRRDQYQIIHRKIFVVNKEHPNNHRNFPFQNEFEIFGTSCTGSKGDILYVLAKLTVRIPTYADSKIHITEYLSIIGDIDAGNA